MAWAGRTGRVLVGVDQRHVLDEPFALAAGAARLAQPHSTGQWAIGTRPGAPRALLPTAPSRQSSSPPGHPDHAQRLDLVGTATRKVRAGGPASKARARSAARRARKRSATA